MLQMVVHIFSFLLLKANGAFSLVVYHLHSRNNKKLDHI